MRRVNRRPSGGGAYRFFFLGMPMTFSKLEEYFEYKTSAFRLKAVWMRWRRPHQIDDPEFFAAAFVNYVQEIEVVGHGVFPTAVAVHRALGVPLNVVYRKIRALGPRLHPSDLEFDRELSERMRKIAVEKRLEKKKEQVTKRHRQAMPSDEWLSFSDRPRATLSQGFHTPY